MYLEFRNNLTGSFDVQQSLEKKHDSLMYVEFHSNTIKFIHVCKNSIGWLDACRIEKQFHGIF